MRPLIQRIALALMASTLISCSGGGDSSSSPPTTEFTPSVTVGTITGFGSVIVNGIRFDDSAASISINGEAGTREQLKVGMVVSVEGQLAACPNPDTAVCTGIASRIRFRNNLEGPITQLNQLTNSIQVMGRDIQFDAGTIVEGGTASDLSGLAVGDLVAISGLEEQLRIRARLVQRLGQFEAGVSAMQVLGTVANLNLANATCTIDGVPVSFAGLGADSLPPGGLSNGQTVQASGVGTGTGLMTADRIQLRDRISFPDAALVQIEGFVSAFVSVADFTVADQKVDATQAVFLNGTAADLGNGVKVLVEGLMQGGVLVASRLVFRLEANAATVNVQLGAPVQSKSAESMSLTLLGTVVKTTPLTQFIDRMTDSSGSGTRPGGAPGELSFDSLEPGDRIDLMAYRDADGGFVATRIERLWPDDLLIAKGPVNSMTPVTALNLFGVSVATGADTRYRDPDGNLVSAVDFYGLLNVSPIAASIVRAQGIASGASSTTIDATRVSDTRGEVSLARE